MKPRCRPRGISSAAAWLVVPLPVLLAASPPPRPAALEAVHTARPPRVDGVLDEPEWATAALIDDFVMQLPEYGLPASERTLVRILHDDENLYLGITCFDSNPSAIRTASLIRDDFDAGSGEQIAFAIDSTDSGRDGFWFSTNPGGAQIDSQVFDEGRIFDPEWDAIWESVGRVGADGWTVEIRLPFFNLRFTEGATNTMRINFFRAIRHKNEEDYSPAIPRNYAGTFSFSLGRPVRFAGIRRGRNLGVKPFALTSAASRYRPAADSDVKGDAGADVKWGVTANFTADFTLHPDFAQVEADDRQINLTRFPLFFPEKREFFLENAGLFSLGAPQQTQAFFSRRIGLDESGQPVEILAGARLTGRSGGWSVGALEAVTDANAGTPRTAYSVVRVRRDAGRRSSLGAILTDREAEGAGGGNRVGGTDAHLVLGQDQFIDVFGMGSWTSGTGGDGYAGEAAYSRQGDRWRYGGFTGFVDEEFLPGIGFVRRPGVQYTGGSLAFRPRPDFPSVRQFEFSVEGNYLEARVADPALEGRVLERTWALWQGTEFESGDRIGVSYDRRFERVTEDFPIAEGVTVPPGDYQNASVEADFTTYGARRLSGSGFVNFGPFFAGHRQAYGVGLTARFDEHLAVSTQYTLNRVRLPFGDFDTNLWITRIDYAFSPRLFGGALIQWNDVTDDLDLNVRLDFIHTPGSDLFLVYNESRNTDPFPGEPRANRRAGIVKVTYLFQF